MIRIELSYLDCLTALGTLRQLAAIDGEVLPLVLTLLTLHAMNWHEALILLTIKLKLNAFVIVWPTD